jgi:excinuclease ABC subunit A
LTPALFSFNNPRGACPGCNGFGAVLEYDESLIVPELARSLADGALDPWTKPRYEGRRRLLRETARAKGIPTDRPWRDIGEREREFLLHGATGRYLGIFPFLERLEIKRYKQYIRVFLRQYQLAKTCPACGGTRLKPEALVVRIAEYSIAQVAALTATELQQWVGRLALSPFQQAVAQHLLAELTARVSFVVDVGLGYLSLDRQTRSLSGGEAQRVALSNALGSRLTDTLYVLDEPSIGLHPSDIDRLLRLLRRLTDAGNTVVVVEHDPAAMAIADWMVELGPGSGAAGGTVVYQGPAEGVRTAGTLTGQYLSGEKRIGVPSARRPAARWLTVRGARLHNLQGVDVRLPLHTLTVVTGVSGSGKSTLVHDVLYRQLERRLKGGHSAKEHLGEAVGEVAALEGWEAIGDVVLIDQSPIGRTPRSNPITYVKAFDELRQLFAALPRARERRFTPSTFSFNVPGGRCEACEGAGHVLVEMVFLANVFVPCEICGGKRFKREVLEVKLDGQSIHDVLEWTVDQALRRFHKQPRLARALWQLQQVGLGYLRLGQPATTLSGGEAQRLKIARELTLAGTRSAPGGGRRRHLYILDEPTTGLHLDDVRTLCRVLDRLVDAGHTVLVIEHHLDVIKRADWIVDLGPGAGAEGGRVVAAGTPEEVARATASVTGRYLQDLVA